MTAGPEPIAIVGMDCLFPGADSVDAYWVSIREGRDAITEVPQSHWRPGDYFDPDPRAEDRTYAKTGGFLSPIDFRPLDHGIPPNTVEATDTSQLLALMVAGRMLADSGYGAMTRMQRERTSVILGVTGALELVIPLGARLGHPQWRRAMAEAGIDDELAADALQRISEGYVSWQEVSFPGLLGNVVAGRIANRLDLGGTNCVVDAACASSLSAVHLAMLELWSGQRDLVITGGVDTFNDIFMYMCFSKTPALSPTGHARPFAANGDGTILGEGVGVLLLKRLCDARRDDDRIYAVIRGMGTASDGKGQAIYAPAASGQARALRQCYEQAGVDAGGITLVEAHGTGTAAGDETELRSLTEVFAGVRADSKWCAIGSVKSQIGHTKAAAGAAGLIKAALALHHKVLPPSIKVDVPLPGLAEPSSPFYLNTVKRPWLSSPTTPRRAAVSAFGFGGSNFHCVLEEGGPHKSTADYSGAVQVWPLASDTVQALSEALTDVERVMANPVALRRSAGLARNAFRSAARYRLTLVFDAASDPAALIGQARRALAENPVDGLWSTPDRRVFYGCGEPDDRRLAVVFPGQGAQYPGMLRDLCCQFPEALTTLADADAANAGQLADVVYPVADFTDTADERQRAELRRTSVAQPAIGAVSLAAYRVLEKFGVAPDAFAGHSFGELTALCAAGRMSAEDFHRLARLRGQLMEVCDGDRGAMIAVAAGFAQCRALLADHDLRLTFANFNAPRQCVLAGATDVVHAAHDVFTRALITSRILEVSAAFHSRYVSAAAAPFAEALERVGFERGAPVYANRTGDVYPESPGAARAVLAEQLTAPVEFHRLIEAMYETGVRTFLELGPGARLTGLIGQILGDRPHHVEALDRSGGTRSGELELAQILAWLTALGYPVAIAALDPQAQHLPDPTAADRFTIKLSGANHTEPVQQRPPRPAASPRQPASPNQNGATPMPQQPEHQPAEHNVDHGALQSAMEATNEHLRALQRFQQQTADLHKQFLDSQERAFEGFREIFDQHRRLVEANLGIPPADRPDPPVRADTAVPPPPVPPPAPVPPPPVSPDPAPVAVPVGDSVSAMLLEVVAEKTGYPSELLDLSMSLDVDLGIDSIKRVEIFSAVSQRVPGGRALGSEELGRVQTLGDAAHLLGGGGQVPVAPVAVPSPVATVAVPSPVAPVAVPVEGPVRLNAARVAPQTWEPGLPTGRAGGRVVVAGADPVSAQAVVAALVGRGFEATARPLGVTVDDELDGLVVISTPRPDAGEIQAWFTEVRAAAGALRSRGGFLWTVSRLDGRFGWDGLGAGHQPQSGALSGLAKTAALEWPEVSVVALDLAADAPASHIARLVDGALAAGPVERGLSAAGSWSTAQLVSVADPGDPVAGYLRADDVVVVTGGARGVTLAAVAAMSRRSHHQTRFVLLGRTDIDADDPPWAADTDDTELPRAAALAASPGVRPAEIERSVRAVLIRREARRGVESLRAGGAQIEYHAVDVRDTGAVSALIDEVHRRIGPVTGIVHGAGVLADRRIQDKTDGQFAEVFDTKVVGLQNLLDAVDATAAAELRVLTIFSSSTARFGRQGQADYAMANEVLNKIACQMQTTRPNCRTLALNWGPWQGGMVTDELGAMFVAEGVGLIPLDRGAEWLAAAIGVIPGPEVVVTATPADQNDGDSYTLAVEHRVDIATHPILDSHVFDRRAVVPAALMLEWLANGAVHNNPGLTLLGADDFRVLKGITVGIDEQRRCSVWTAAPRHVGEEVHVAVELRGDADSTAQRHACATVVLGYRDPAVHPRNIADVQGGCRLDDAELYPDMLFHGPELRVITSVTGCSPEGISAELSRLNPAPAEWIAEPLRTRWLTDPLGLDAVFQLLIVWSVVQRGVPAMPTAVQRFRLNVRPPAGRAAAVHIGVSDVGSHHLRADAEILDESGAVLAVVGGAESVLDAALRRAFARTELAPRQ